MNKGEKAKIGIKESHSGLSPRSFLFQNKSEIKIKNNSEGGWFFPLCLSCSEGIKGGPRPQKYSKALEHQIILYITMSLQVFANPVTFYASSALLLSALSTGAKAEQHLTYIADSNMQGFYLANDEEEQEKAAKETTQTSSTETATETATQATACATAWGQCGGTDFTGASCCQPGLQCVTLDSYWAHCVQPSTMSTVSTSGSTDSASASSLKSGVHMIDQRSTLYSYKVHTEDIKVQSTDVSGHVYKTNVQSESTETVIKGFTHFMKESTEEANGASANTNNFFASSQHGNWKTKLSIVALLGLGVLAM